MIKTSRWSTNRGTATHALEPSSPYHDLFESHERLADRFVQSRKTRPEHVAEAVYRALTARRPRMRYVVGRPASVVVALRGLLPDRVFERVYFGALMRRIVGKPVRQPLRSTGFDEEVAGQVEPGSSNEGFTDGVVNDSIFERVR
ncbi:MAG: hypothetical protein U0790_22410 [Isosphaeraceae bacterium]